MTSKALVTNLRALIDGGLPLTLGDVIDALERTAWQPTVTLGEDERKFIEVLAMTHRERVRREKAELDRDFDTTELHAKYAARKAEFLKAYPPLAKTAD